MNALDAGQRMITVGRLHGAFGVRGELKLESFTAPENAILRYQPWTLRDAQGRERLVEGARGRGGAKGLVATLPGIEGRDAAEAMRGTEVLVPRSALPPPGPGEYYWVDLIGLDVINREGVALGQVRDLMTTGPQTVRVLAYENDGKPQERMIPFVAAFVDKVELPERRITVDWQPDY